MERDPSTGEWRLAVGGDEAGSSALALLSDEDRGLALKFESSGGLALTLANSFRLPDRLRREARRLLERFEADGNDASGILREELEESEERGAERAEIAKAAAGVLDIAGLGFASERLLSGDVSPVERAVFLMQAADIAEEREAVMRNVWSDVEFQGGDADNAELVGRLESQFAGQLLRSTKARQAAEDEAKTRRGSAAEAAEAEELRQDEQATNFVDVATGSDDAIFDVALRECESIADLQLDKAGMDAALLEPRNLGVGLDLVGVYLKNYNIDKADLVINRLVPLCRKRGGVWLVKGLDKLSAVRMKQFRAQEALVAMREIESIVPFAPEEGWEFHDILYRNLAWCYSSLDEAELCLEYTRKSVEVKKACGIPSTWFDIWDLSKGHARLGQKNGQLQEIRTAYDLCVRAGEVHRKAEPSDKVMLAKVLSNTGEIALGIGDLLWMKGVEGEAFEWYGKAEPWLLEAFELHRSALGPWKPLTGWAAGTVAHCLVRLKRDDEAFEFLTLAWKVECTKDSTTTGSVIELLDRVVSVAQRLGDSARMTPLLGDLEQGVAGLRARGWHSREREIFALLLHKAATTYLLADGGAASSIRRALELLREAEDHLVVHLRDEQFKCWTCGALHQSAEGLQAHRELDHPSEDHAPPKQFGPREDPNQLLEQVQSSLRVLRLAEEVVSGSFESRQPARFAEESRETQPPPPPPFEQTIPETERSEGASPHR